jgi:RNA polymerase sigma-70 factor (ECF subfamily)
MSTLSAVTTIEDALVQNCLGGDPEAWRGLHRRYYPIAVAFLRKLGADEEDVEDAAQEVFVELFRYLPTFRGQADLKTWLYRLCATQARRIRHRSRILRVIREKLQSDAPAPAAPAATMTDASLVRHMKAALDQMNEGDRLVFVLYEFEGLSGKQIAPIANCPESTVWRRLHYARRIFRDTLGVHTSEAVGGP